MRAALPWGVLALALVAALAPLAAIGLPAFEVRQVPYQLQAGTLLPEVPLSQVFTCPVDGLSALELHTVALREPRAGEAVGLVVEFGSDRRMARAEASSVDAEGWLRFEFEPIGDSRGTEMLASFYALETRVPLAAHLRYRGRVGMARAWGSHPSEAAVQERAFRSDHPDLAGLAIPFARLDREQGQPWLFVEDEAGETVAAEQPFSQPQLEELRGQVAMGYVLFLFEEPIQDARWRDLTLRLRNPGHANVIGAPGGPAFAALHRHRGGVLDRDSPLQSGGGPPFADLVLRARSDLPVSALAASRERLGGRTWVALALLAAGALAAGFALRRLAALDRVQRHTATPGC